MSETPAGQGRELDAAWDAAAARSRHGHVMQSHAWGRLRASYGWNSTLLRIGDPLPVASLLWRHFPLGFKIAYVPRGPVFDHDDPAQFDAALAALARRARETGAVFLKVDPEIPVEREDLLALYAKHGFFRSRQDVQPVLATLELDLRQDEPAIFAGLDKDTRWSVRTGERRGVAVTERSDLEALTAFYRLYEETGKRAEFITRSEPYYLDLWRTLLDAGHATLFVATVEDEIAACAMLFWCGDRAVYMYGASGDLARRTYASYLLQWHCIRAARERGCARYDLGGIPREPDERDPMWGVYLFKKGFGGVRREFAGAHDYTARPALYRLWLAAEPWAYVAVARLRGRRAELPLARPSPGAGPS